MAKIVITERGRNRLYEVMEETVVIGASREANLQVRDAKASGLHCQIKRTPQGWKLVDLESKAGTAVNGRLVNQHLLKDGDRIQVGEVVLAFQDEPKAGGPAPRDRERERERKERERSRKSSLPAPAIAGMIIGGAVIGVLVLVFLFQSAAETSPDMKILLQVDRLYDKGEFEAAEAKLRDLERLPEISPIGTQQKAEFERKLAERRQVLARKAEFEKAMEEADQIIRAVNQIPPRYNRRQIEEIRRRIEDFKVRHKEFPQTFDRFDKAYPLLEHKLHPKPGEDAEDDQ